MTTDSSGDNTVLTFIIRPILLFLPGCKAMTSFGETANRSQTQNTRLYLYKKTPKPGIYLQPLSSQQVHFKQCPPE